MPENRPREMDLGDLTPVSEVLAWVEERLAHDKTTRAADDHGVLALAEVQKRLSKAIADAKHADLELTVEQYARIEGVSIWAIYKRLEQKKVPGARRGPGGFRIALNPEAAADAAQDPAA